MPVRHLDHVNIRTSEVAATLEFYRDVLGMRIASPTVDLTQGYGGWLLDDSDAPIVHVGHVDQPYPSDQRLPFTPARGSGAVHHVALECSDYDQMMGRIAARGLTFDRSDVPEVSLTQIFITDPNGIILELNFRG